MTNIERIRSMTDEEMTEYFRKVDFCPPYTNCKSYYTCDECWLNWLHEEAEEDKK